MRGPSVKIVGLALTALCLLAPTARAADATPLPADLDLAPRDAAGFVHLRVGDLWRDDGLADLRRVLEHAGPEALRQFDRKHVPAPSTVDRVTVVLLTPETWFTPFPAPDPVAVSALTIVATSKPFDPDVLRKVAGGPTRTYEGKCYDLNERTWQGVFVVDHQTFVLGTEDAIRLLLDRRKAGGKDGPLAGALREATGNKNVVTAAVNPRPFADAGLAAQLPPPLHPLLRADCGLATVALGRELKFGVHLHYADAAAAADGEKAVVALLGLARAALQQQARDAERQLAERTKGEPTGWQNFPDSAALLSGLAMLRFADASLKELPLRRDGNAVGFRYNAGPVNALHYGMLGLTAITTLGTNAQNTFTYVGNRIGGPAEEHAELKRIGAALEKYHAEHGHYPPAALRGKGGEPLLSWRVALLPYLGEEALHRQFKLDEPWDGPHNKGLLLRRPAVFNRGWQSCDHWMTTYQVFAGPGTLFEGQQGPRKQDAARGLANTLLLAASDEPDAAVPWTKPADAAFDSEKPLAGPWDGKTAGFVALFADGTVRKVPKGTPEKTIRAWVARDGRADDKPSK